MALARFPAVSLVAGMTGHVLSVLPLPSNGFRAMPVNVFHQLDQLGVTGSSPVPPHTRKPPETEAFLVLGADGQMGYGADVVRKW